MLFPGYNAVMYAIADRNDAWSQLTDIIALPDAAAATYLMIMFDA
jgi:hypothetical protein